MMRDRLGRRLYDGCYEEIGRDSNAKEMLVVGAMWSEIDEVVLCFATIHVISLRNEAPGYRNRGSYIEVIPGQHISKLYISSRVLERATLISKNVVK